MSTKKNFLYKQQKSSKIRFITQADKLNVEKAKVPFISAYMIKTS